MRVFDYGEPGSADSAERPFLVMELVDGPSLADLLASGPADAGRTMDVIAQAAAALHAAHRAGCVHGAIGPQNILLSRDGRVKLIGFGAGHRAGRGPGSAAGDLYALGVVAQLCLTGNNGPGGAAATALPGQIPAPVAAFIGQLTAREPAARPATAAQVSRRAARLRDQLAPAGPASRGAAAISRAARLTPRAATGMPPAATVRDSRSRRKRRAAATRQRGLAAMPTFAVVALALAAVALLGALKPHGDAAQAGGTARTTTVRVNAGGLIGQPVRDVRHRLKRLGLLVQVRWQPSGRVSPGKVLYVRPAGSVPVHSRITLIGTIRPSDAASATPAVGQASSPPRPRHSARPARHGPGTRLPHPSPSTSSASSPAPSRTPSASPSPSHDPSPTPSSPPPTSPPPSGSPSPSRSTP